MHVGCMSVGEFFVFSVGDSSSTSLAVVLSGGLLCGCDALRVHQFGDECEKQCSSVPLREGVAEGGISS